MSHVPKRRPDRTTYENVQGKQSTARVFYNAPDHEALIEIKRDSEQWVLGIDEEATADLLHTDTTTDDLLGQPEIPDWLRETLLGLGIEGVDQ